MWLFFLAKSGSISYNNPMKKERLVVLVMIGFLGGCVPFANNEPKEVSVDYPIQPFEKLGQFGDFKDDPSIVFPEESSEQVEVVVRGFMNNFINGVPPADNVEAALAARSYLTNARA